MKKIGSRFGYVIQYKVSGKFHLSYKDVADNVVDAKVWPDYDSAVNYAKTNKITALIDIVRVILTVEIKPIKTNKE